MEQPRRGLAALPRRAAGVAAADGDPFAPISDAAYEVAAAQYKAAKGAGLSVGKAPLNVEQRAGARPFLQAVQMRTAGTRRGESARQIADAVKAAGLSQTTLVVGAGKQQLRRYALVNEYGEASDARSRFDTDAFQSDDDNYERGDYERDNIDTCCKNVGKF